MEYRFDCLDLGRFGLDSVGQLLDLFDYHHQVFVVAFCTCSKWLKNLED